MSKSGFQPLDTSDHSGDELSFESHQVGLIDEEEEEEVRLHSSTATAGTKGEGEGGRGERPNLRSDSANTITSFRTALRTAAELAPLRTGVRDFYEKQNELINSYVEMHNLISSNEEEANRRRAEEEAKNASHERLNKVAMWSSFGLGVPLVLLTLTAFVLSGSMALLATALDSILDQISQLIMLVTLWWMKRTRGNKALFPAGNNRVEPLGLVVFSAIMMTAFFQLIITSIEDLVNQATVEFDAKIGIIIGTNITIKGTLWIVCYVVFKKTGSSSVEAFAQDHRNDVFVNACAASAMLTASYLWWWVDSTVAILLALYIIVSWAKTLFDVLYQLAGTSAPPSLISSVLYLAKHHHPQILAVESVRAWHLSENFIVELDIVLPREMPLEEAHEIGETLQNLIEEMELVERAFVHLDVDLHHKPEHE